MNLGMRVYTPHCVYRSILDTARVRHTVAIDMHVVNLLSCDVAFAL